MDWALTSHSQILTLLGGLAENVGLADGLRNYILRRPSLWIGPQPLDTSEE